jgi:hypothetical protein
VTIAVTGGVPPAPSCTDTGQVSVTASPSRVQSGVPTNVTFTVNASNSSGICTLSGPGITPQTYKPTACVVSSRNYTATGLTITAQSTYTFSCPGGQTGQVIVNIVPKFKEF